MKKSKILLYSTLLGLLLAGCGTQNTTKTQETPDPSEPTILETGESLMLDTTNMLKVVQKKSDKVEQTIFRDSKEYNLSVKSEIDNSDDIELYYKEKVSK